MSCFHKCSIIIYFPIRIRVLDENSTKTLRPIDGLGQPKHYFDPGQAHFDRLVLSYEVGHIKPSAAFYLACAEAAVAEPGDCVFIDDLPANVAGGRALGWHGIVFTGISELREDLAQLGIIT